MCAQVLLLAHLNISTAGGLFRDDDGVASRSRVGSHGMRKSGTTIIIITFGKKKRRRLLRRWRRHVRHKAERERERSLYLTKRQFSSF